MASSMTVKFLTPLSMGARITFKLGNTEIFFNVVTQRLNPNEIQYSNTVNTISSNYRNALVSDYLGAVTATVAGDTVTIVSVSNISNFSSGTVIGGGSVQFNYTNTSSAVLAVEGLSSNNYFINNDILVRLRCSNALGGYFRIQLENQTTGKTTNFITSKQGADGTAIVNLSPIVKGIFSYPIMVANDFSLTPSHNGCDVIKINISYLNGTGQVNYTTTKKFIRGGTRTDRTNITVPLGYLMPTAKIPVWSGRDVTVSNLTSEGIRIIPLASINPDVIVNMKTKGCESTYIKFLNEKGGYSYWLFENFNYSESNTALGSYVRLNGGYFSGVASVNGVPRSGYQDLGSESDSTIILTSKVPAQFLPYMNDLIVSPDIYMYDTRLASGSSDGAWHHVTSSKNTITAESNRKAYNVKITLNIDNRFNPSLIW